MDTESGQRDLATGLVDRHRERGELDRLMNAVRAGESRALVVRGDPGVGKTVLLDYLAGQAAGCRVARAAGVQSEMELAFAGLHQLCAPMLDRAGRLPVPQREALRTAFGLSAGPPDRFLVGLAVLSLLSEVAGEQPLICVIDDEQWLDHASAQVLGFAARRLTADPVALVFAARVPGEELAGLPEMAIEGLPEDDARALLDSALTGPLDTRVRDLIVAETQGNPLALVELPRGLTPAQLAGGFGLPAAPLSGRIEDSFRRRLIRPAIRSWSGARPGSWTSPFRRRRRRPTRAWWTSVPKCGSGTRWYARRPIGRRRFRTGARPTAHWPRLPIRSPIPTAGPGTRPKPRPGPMRRSRQSWSTRPAERRPAAGWPRPRRFWGARWR